MHCELWKDSHDAARLSLHAIATVAVASMACTPCRAAPTQVTRCARPAGHDGRDDGRPGCNGTTMRTITPGSGKEITKGLTATVHATGVVKESGQEVLVHQGPGPQAPFTYQAGVGGVIGWDQGCLGMKVGEARELIIPAHGGLRRVRLPGLGHPAGRNVELHPSAQGRVTGAHQRPSLMMPPPFLLRTRARTALFSLYQSGRHASLKSAAGRPRPARRRASRASSPPRLQRLGARGACARASMRAARRR